MDKDRTNVLLDKDMMISLKNMARLENKSVTMIVRDAITDYLTKNISKKEFGIIGIGESRSRGATPEKKKIIKEF
ncbi:MAG: ribbon-helix-helix domain-containing protein [Candidatus Humimicrobiaceae bacterium]